MKLVIVTSEKKKNWCWFKYLKYAVSAKGSTKVSKEDQGTNVVSSVFTMCPTTVGFCSTLSQSYLVVDIILYLSTVLDSWCIGVTIAQLKQQFHILIFMDKLTLPILFIFSFDLTLYKTDLEISPFLYTNTSNLWTCNTSSSYCWLKGIVSFICLFNFFLFLCRVVHLWPGVKPSVP